MLPACDISKYQGAWQNYPCDIVLIKMSGGDNGLYLDPNAATNYTDAKSAGKHVGGYHFIGWTLGAAQEAAYFYKAMSPVAENDVFCLDVEAIPSGVNPVEYTLQMIQYLQSKDIKGGLVYMNLSTLNAYDWTPVLSLWGLWLADWNNNPAGTISTKFLYVMQQYSDGPSYDHDEWFGTLAEFDAYGYHAPVAAPAPAPEPVAAPAPVVAPPEPVIAPPVVYEPVSTPIPVVINQPVVVPKPIAQPVPAPVVVSTPVKLSWFQKLIQFLKSLIGK